MNVRKRALLLHIVLAALCVSVLVLGQALGVAHAATPRTYTVDADFDEGTLVGVEHDTVHDQLQLARTSTTLPFIWVPNNDGTISKLNTESGKELGRYKVAPTSGCSPSRTTVDLEGACYVGNRQAGTVVKVGLVEFGQWVDRNGNGVCDTSQDANNDGFITGAEILAWGADEAVLREITLVPGHEASYAPGANPGWYDANYWGVAPRGLAVDRNNNLWAGTWSTSKYYQINGATGAIMQTVDVSPLGHNAYGAVIDPSGALWSTNLYSHVLRLDLSMSSPTMATLSPSQWCYGIGLDYLGHVFVTGWESGRLTRISYGPPPTLDWTKPSYADGVRGIAATSDNNMWTANSNSGYVTRLDNDGNMLARIHVGDTPTGVAVDAAGKVWVVGNGDEHIRRIDPATNAVDLTKQIIGSGGHYGYSDMTGIVARSISTRLGTWTVVRDSGAAGTDWSKVSWNSNEPAGTQVRVKVRSSEDQVTWSAWETAANGVALSSTPNGRYLQVEATLQILAGETSPILYDLTVMPEAAPPVLTMTRGAIRWSNYAARELEVTFNLRNIGAGPALNSRISMVTATGGATVLTPVPIAVGNIPPAGSLPFTVKYRIPLGATSFSTTLRAMCEDAGGNTHTF